MNHERGVDVPIADGFRVPTPLGPRYLGDDGWVMVTRLHWNGGGARMWREWIGVEQLCSRGDGSPRRQRRMDPYARDFCIGKCTSEMGIGSGVVVWVDMAPMSSSRRVRDRVHAT
jgi:hypothetical protein